ncbi:MAG: carbohydrate kinase, partial [Cyanobacteria bacterium P01_H01_bin.119]
MPVLCFGEILVDCLAERPQQSLASEQTWMTYAGGAPANVASALAKLGQSVCFMGCVGNDHSGRALIATLTEAGVNCDYATLHRTLPTRQVYVLRDPEGDRQFLGFGERDPASFADAQFKPEWVAAEGFEKADFLVMGTLGLAYPDTGQAMARALTLADAQFAKVVVDVNWRPSFWPQPELAGPIILEFLRQADFLKLSADEAHWLFQTDAPQAIAQRLDQLEGVMVT